MIALSSCLTGVKCRYNGGGGEDVLDGKIAARHLKAAVIAIVFCFPVFCSLSVPTT